MSAFRNETAIIELTCSETQLLPMSRCGPIGHYCQPLYLVHNVARTDKADCGHSRCRPPRGHATQDCTCGHQINDSRPRLDSGRRWYQDSFAAGYLRLTDTAWFREYLMGGTSPRQDTNNEDPESFKELKVPHHTLIATHIVVVPFSLTAYTMK